MTYYVIVCPKNKCNGVTIVEDKTETKLCSQCDRSFKWKRFSKEYITEDMDDARTARTKVLTEMRDSAPSFETAIDKGYLQDKERTSNHEKDTRDPKTIINDAIDSVDTTTKEQIIQHATESKLSEKKAEKVFEKMIQNGHLIKQNSTYQKV